MTEPVLYQASEGVATITLNRPEVLNAVNAGLLASLLAAIQRASDDAEVRAVVLTGAGRGFCAGSDLVARHKAGLDSVDLGKSARDNLNPVITAMRSLSKPLLTAVNGPAAGAGMSIALAGDLVVASRSAKFALAFTKIGLVPDGGNTYFLPRYVGELRARALTILGETVDAEEACRIGMVWKVYDGEAFAEETGKLARHLANMPTRAIGICKQALNASSGNELAAQLELEASLQTCASQTDDFREGVAAFVQKRAPQFKGC
ncbi:enoyl-CoA hydratase-related protein [Cupriavidus oxalaticus]|uniref:2-(1,2-epoxy-1,2-dihydrophenyl)acetyl-CoA isomerase n=1 Tax=Cupriavidus oxalaticus TaxID=96344 RepID=A0A5P3VS36_9BURK|nr:enoyl-CoA hydratase-related protein [Cupriavidus oxalaticus]QEZ48927.1 2-(1,2-epoxy-1,2-dihydrophenyl)acetyl-CoA isomerase [Cupriavidus oxalaticus]